MRVPGPLCLLGIRSVRQIRLRVCKQTLQFDVLVHSGPELVNRRLITRVVALRGVGGGLCGRASRTKHNRG